MNQLSQILFEITGFELSISGIMIILLCGFLVGTAKTGLSGAGLAVVPLMAQVFGSKPSTGILLPILIMADVFAVKYYNRHAEWKHVFRLLPWAFTGILTGAFIGKYISDDTFSQILSFLIMSGVILMIWQDIKKDKIKIPDHWWFAALMGLSGGFATMVGNSAGPIMALYLLAMRFPKNVFIGTGAWFFLIINVSKVPLHIFIWNTIDFKTFTLDLITFPAIILGVFIGIKLVKLIPERLFKSLIIITTLVTTILILRSTFNK